VAITQPAFTVVIPARNAAATLADQMTALAQQRGVPAFHVIVVDNGSSDDTADVARRFDCAAMTVQVVDEPEPGINRARNAGIASARTDLVLLCDADDVADPLWAQELVGAIEDNTWTSGALDFTRLNTERTRNLWGGAERLAPDQSSRFRDTGHGGNCCISKAMWVDVGGFDDLLSGNGDETEFFLRAWAGGYRLVWVPSAVVHHRQRASAAAMMRRRWQQGRSQVRLMKRPTYPPDAPRLTLASATRSSLGGVRRLIAAPLHRSSPWPWVGVVALNVGRGWQLVCEGVSRPPSGH
jgi:glycosyltransferase involved in cell wall biosynthesis